MTAGSQYRQTLRLAAVGMALLAGPVAGQTPPVVDTIFPAGVQAGQIVEVTASGSNLQGLHKLHSNIPGIQCEPLEPNRFRLTIPPAAPPGLYDLWAVGDNGVSAPRTFAIGNRAERLETEPNESLPAATAVPLDVAIHGRIDKAGDLEHFRFAAKRGQRVVIECWAERIDSRLRAVLELFDAAGKRLAVNRGYFGVDPLIDFRVPADGLYVVKIHDLASTGSAEHYYRLDVDTGPRVAFCLPPVVERGKTSRVTLYGWNLNQPGASTAENSSNSDTTSLDAFEQVEVDIPATLAVASRSLPIRCAPAGAVLEGFAYLLPGSHAPLAIGVTDVPVVIGRSDNHSAASAQLIACPSEVSAQLAAEDERDWYAIEAQRGEVFYFEGLGQRIHSPVDLDISVLDSAGERELAQFGDEIRSVGEGEFPTNHLDPAGRWVAPSTGRFLISVRNLSGGITPDPRRIYRLSVRREEPDFQLVAVPQSGGLNVRRGGRELLDLLALRRRGWNGAIRVSAKDLPAGVECPDVWLGPGVDRATVVVSADRNAAAVLSELKLDGFAEELALTQRRPVRGGVLVRSGTPNAWGRLASAIPLAVTGDAPLRIVADGHETLNHHLYGKLQVKHSPGGILDVAVQIERRDTNHQAPIKLIGVGLPDLIRNQSAIVPAGEPKGYLSFYLPPTLPVGRYSLTIRAQTTVPTADQKSQTVVVHSNPVTFDVQPAAFLVEVDPFAPTRARRGEVLQLRYSAQRRNGFIGKMHTELATPDRITDVVGLRGRGETFVGQTESGSLQITVNDDAPLGRQPFLRLFTVGVLEDQPIYFGSSFLALEIVE